LSPARRLSPLSKSLDLKTQPINPAVLVGVEEAIDPSSSPLRRQRRRRILSEVSVSLGGSMDRSLPGDQTSSSTMNSVAYMRLLEPINGIIGSSMRKVEEPAHVAVSKPDMRKIIPHFLGGRQQGLKLTNNALISGSHPDVLEDKQGGSPCLD
jgi:hypothetical protein